MEQQADRKRDKPRPAADETLNKETKAAEDNFDQKLEKLKSSMTEYTASVEKPKQTTEKQKKQQKPEPKIPPPFPNPERNYQEPKR